MAFPTARYASPPSLRAIAAYVVTLPFGTRAQTAHTFSLKLIPFTTRPARMSASKLIPRLLSPRATARDRQPDPGFTLIRGTARFQLRDAITASHRPPRTPARDGRARTRDRPCSARVPGTDPASAPPRPSPRPRPA